jgi:hypothetical protein
VGFLWPRVSVRLSSFRTSYPPFRVAEAASGLTVLLLDDLGPHWAHCDPRFLALAAGFLTVLEGVSRCRSWESLAIAGFRDNIFDLEEAHAMRRPFVAACASIAIIVSVANQLDYLTHMFAQDVVGAHQQVHRPVLFCQPVFVRMASQASRNCAFTFMRESEQEIMATLRLRSKPGL